MADIGAMIRAWRCRQLAAALVDYAADNLPPAARRRVEEHIAGCADCAAMVAALSDAPAVLRGTVPARGDVFWRAQREGVMDAIRAGSGHHAPPPRMGFDWRLALPVAAALAIAFAGYLSLRPPSAPGEVALDVLAPEDLSVLVAVAESIMPPQELLPDLGTAAGGAVGGAVDAGWIRADELPPPSWGELDDDDLEALHGMVG